MLFILFLHSYESTYTIMNNILPVTELQVL